jgi:hypothetical protein
MTCSGGRGKRGGVGLDLLVVLFEIGFMRGVLRQNVLNDREFSLGSVFG